jgi:hypothetical protein
MFGVVLKRWPLVAPSCAAAALIALAACSGSTSPAPTPFHQPTARPTATPSTAPSTSPSASVAPSTSPTASSAPSPSPTATGAPTPSPSPTSSAAVIVLAPTAGAVGNNGGCPPDGPHSYTFTATETGYTGSFTFTPESGSAAQFTVTPASVGNGGTFTVTDNNPTVATGVWSVVVKDSSGNTATESVTSVTCLE